MSDGKVLCSIAARAGSKGVPGKNLRLLGGRPLIAYAIEAALSASTVDMVVVSTEDEEIAAVARRLGAEVPFLRLPSLAGDRVALHEVTRHTMLEMDERGFHADIVVQLSPTCPFLTAKWIDESVGLVKSGQGECAVTLKAIVHDHPYRARRLLEDGSFENFLRDIDVERFHSRQDLPPLYCTTGGIYTRARHLLDNYDGKDFALGTRRLGIVLAEIEAVNIDTLIDFYFAEFLIERGYARPGSV